MEGSPKELLVEGNEEGHCRFCFKMFGMSTSQNRTSKTSRIDAKNRSANMEMGTYNNGFCSRVTKDTKES